MYIRHRGAQLTEEVNVGLLFIIGILGFSDDVPYPLGVDGSNTE